MIQRRGGTARHDAVAWGYARAADSLGVDIIQNCEVTGFTTSGGRVTGVETSRGAIGSPTIGICVAGNSGHVAGSCGNQAAGRGADIAGFRHRAGQAR